MCYALKSISNILNGTESELINATEADRENPHLQKASQRRRNLPSKLVKQLLEEPITIQLQPWEEMICECIAFSIENGELTIDLIANDQQFRIISHVRFDAGVSAFNGSKWIGNKIGVLKTDNQNVPVVLRIIEEKVGNERQ